MMCNTMVYTYTLSLTHLMKVGPSSNNDYLSIAWVAEVSCQLPLSGPVPAHIEEYFDDDEYNNNSGKQKGNKINVKCVGNFTHKFQSPAQFLQNSVIIQLHKLYSHVPIQLHFCEMLITD